MTKQRLAGGRHDGRVSAASSAAEPIGISRTAATASKECALMAAGRPARHEARGRDRDQSRSKCDEPERAKLFLPQDDRLVPQRDLVRRLLNFTCTCDSNIRGPPISAQRVLM